MSRQIDLFDLPVEYLGSQLLHMEGASSRAMGGESLSLDSEEGRSSFIQHQPPLPHPTRDAEHQDSPTCTTKQRWPFVASQDP
jgi:hypothetical protein